MPLNCLSLGCKDPSPIALLPRNKLHISPQSRLNPICSPNSLSSPSSYPQIKCRLEVSFEDIAAIAQNKVLIAAGVSAAIGQFSKPFTSVLLYGSPFNIKAVIQAGGFPSTHSSAVVATATSLALERGFSDSIFGMTLVYASLVMYDAQGVRREVGIHAKTINRAVLMGRTKYVLDEDSNDVKEASSAKLHEANGGTRLEERLVSNTEIESERSNSYSLMKESIGHTEIEVIAGAVLGFLVSLTVHAII